MALNHQMQNSVRRAIREFWMTRKRQARSQGLRSGTRDTGSRTAVIGGAQMNGFVTLVRELLHENGFPNATVFYKRYTIELPGWYRPEKQWDLIVVKDGRLLAAVEFKSQVGSFGNNYNNRTNHLPDDEIRDRS